MAILHLTPSDWYAGLHQTSRHLRAAWAQDWLGLPVVLDECLVSLGLEASADADISAMNRFARTVGSDMEALARSRPTDAEPAYHNRLHTADVLVAITTMMHTQGVAHNTVAKPWAAMLLATAMAHDYDHPGGVNRAPFEIEKHSWSAVALRAKDLPDPWRRYMEQLILRTDIQAVPLNHEHVAEQVFDWDLPWCQVMLNEADILLSACAEFGPGLGQALAHECVRAGFADFAIVGTNAGRARFLRQIRFSSTAALALNMPDRVQAELDTLSNQGTP
jgi:hypothetical protein